MWAQPDSWCQLPVGFMLVIHILYDVYFICSSSLSMDSVRYIANHDVLCFLPSETAFWRLSQNEHSSLVGRTQRETVNGQSSRWKECWTPQEEPKKSSISTEEPEEPHRLSALLQPKRPINNSLSSLEVFTAARAGSQQLHYYSSCHRVLSRSELRPLALFSKLISEPYCGSAIHCESRRARGEQVNRSFSTVVFDVEHSLRRFLSVCREQTQGSQEIWLETSRSARLAIQMSEKVLCVLMSKCFIQMLCAERTLLPLVSIKVLGDKVQHLKNNQRKQNYVKICFEHQHVFFSLKAPHILQTSLK